MSYLCGPRKATSEDMQIVAEFKGWLTTQARKRKPVRTPQACNCGANSLINVAHWEGCASRTMGS